MGWFGGSVGGESVGGDGGQWWSVAVLVIGDK